MWLWYSLFCSCLFLIAKSEECSYLWFIFQPKCYPLRLYCKSDYHGNKKTFNMFSHTEKRMENPFSSTSLLMEDKCRCWTLSINVWNNARGNQSLLLHSTLLSKFLDKELLLLCMHSYFDLCYAKKNLKGILLLIIWIISTSFISWIRMYLEPIPGGRFAPWISGLYHTFTDMRKFSIANESNGMFSWRREETRRLKGNPEEENTLKLHRDSSSSSRFKLRPRSYTAGALPTVLSCCQSFEFYNFIYKYGTVQKSPTSQKIQFGFPNITKKSVFKDTCVWVRCSVKMKELVFI